MAHQHQQRARNKKKWREKQQNEEGINISM